jgi:hypothetical protein
VKELYADFNNIAADGTLPLTSVGSVESIAGVGGALRDGEEVCLTDGELRVVAHVHRQPDGSWEARSDWEFSGGTLPARDR